MTDEYEVVREKIKAEYVRFNHQLIAITARANVTGDYTEIEAAEEKFYSQILSLPEITILAKDQIPPPAKGNIDEGMAYYNVNHKAIYESAQDVMLKSNFKRVIEK